MSRWRALRRQVLARDGLRCHVCEREIAEEEYECGHVVDRMVGGADHEDNLVVMCILCNRLKPVHASREEYEQWRKVKPWVRLIAENRVAIPADVPSDRLEEIAATAYAAYCRCRAKGAA